MVFHDGSTGQDKRMKMCLTCIFPTTQRLDTFSGRTASGIGAPTVVAVSVGVGTVDPVPSFVDRSCPWDLNGHLASFLYIYTHTHTQLDWPTAGVDD